MTNQACQERRPLWVRLVLRAAMRRSAALLAAGSLFLLAGFDLFAAFIGSGSHSLLGDWGLPVGLASACLSAITAIWCWLAVRWVDRNGRWPEQARQRGD
jgi:hypothetical protein